MIKSKRWIGPIPSVSGGICGEPGDLFYHPGGPCPAWGGYSPMRVGISWSEFCQLAEGGKTTDLWDESWKAHMSETRLRFAPDGWYVEAPVERLAWRCVSIAKDALRDHNTEAQILALGITAEELEEAKKELVVYQAYQADHNTFACQD